MANKCKECGAEADPNSTFEGPDGLDDLYFCKKCRDTANYMWGLIENAVVSGDLSIEKLEESLRAHEVLN